MKGLVLWQPYASLMALEKKRFETRPWSTAYRGPVLICAAKGGLSKKKLLDLLDKPEFQEALRPIMAGRQFSNRRPAVDYALALPYGAPLAVAELRHCQRTESLSPEQYQAEAVFGNFSPGRYAWEFGDVRRLPLHPPILMPGRQRLFDIPPDVVHQVEERLRRPF